jgi:hypothetical protein
MGAGKNKFQSHYKKKIWAGKKFQSYYKKLNLGRSIYVGSGVG